MYDIIVHFDALGGSSTVSVGDSGAAARYIAATSTASAGQMAMSQEGAIDGVGYENTAETDVLLTTEVLQSLVQLKLLLSTVTTNI